MSADAEDRSPGAFELWWVAEHGSPPTVGQYGEFAAARKGWRGAVAYLLPQIQSAETRIEQLQGDLIAAGEGHPVLVCPNCGSPSADYDGFGLVACPRDPACYCTHPSSDDGTCTICGHKEADDD
jgi:hypothetical protein